MPHTQLLVAEAPLQKLVSPFLEKYAISLYVKRLDLIHPTVKGNKWYKLKYNLAEAIRQGKDTIETFGGAYSNHLYATAAACNLLGFKSIGKVRGEETLPLNPVLSFVVSQGMQLTYLDRSSYQIASKYQILPQILSTTLQNEMATTNLYSIPEGGSNLFAVQGCQEIAAGLEDFDVVCCACGTGCTLAGISAGLPSKVKKIGFAVLKGGEFLYQDIQKLTTATENLQIMTNYHAGGYAKKTPELLKFMTDFETTYNIPLEYVYTGKLFYGLFDLIQQNFFEKNTKIVAIHTGGV
jgi:1-aminocyclopropane-1-carboxylate deaminase